MTTTLEHLRSFLGALVKIQAHVARDGANANVSP
jgi:hypothetical protein